MGCVHVISSVHFGPGFLIIHATIKSSIFLVRTVTAIDRGHTGTNLLELIWVSRIKRVAALSMWIRSSSSLSQHVLVIGQSSRRSSQSHDKFALLSRLAVHVCDTPFHFRWLGISAAWRQHVLRMLFRLLSGSSGTVGLLLLGSFRKQRRLMLTRRDVGIIKN